MLKSVLRQAICASAALLVLGACAPAAPAPTAAPAAPAKPTSAPAAKPAESPAAKPQPAGAGPQPAAASPQPAGASPQASPAAAATNPGGPFMAEDSPEWQQILAAARQEGEVTMYGGVEMPPLFEKLRSDFEAKYGFKVNIIPGTGAESEERIQTEHDSGRHIASLYVAGESSSWNLLQAGVLEEMPGLPNGARIVPFEYGLMQTFQNRAWPIQATIYGLVINRDLVPEGQEPKTWKDVLDPKWKGKIAEEDPTRSGGSSNVFDVMMRTPGYGEEFHQKLKAQDPLFVRSPAEVERTIVRGERAIGFPGAIQAPSRNPGTPLRWIAPQDGVVVVSSSMGILQGAPAPNAAKVFANWLLSPEFQAQEAKELSLMPTIRGVSHPLGLSLETMTTLGPGRPAPAGAAAMREKAREIYGR